MRILITGAAGFVGTHLRAHLESLGHTVTGIDIAERIPPSNRVDLTDPSATDAWFSTVATDAVVHLAARAFVPDAQRNMADMLNANIGATWNLLQALATHAPEARLLLASSAQVYGTARGDAPIPEEAPLHPENLYALSKAAAELACRGHAGPGPRWMIVRPGNHSGPGQAERFAVPGFIRQLRACRKAPHRRLRVGNLESICDFTDVRDVVDGYARLLVAGRDSTVYNLSADRRIRMRDLLNQLCTLLGVDPEREVQAERFRATDIAPRLDTHKIRTDCGWQPRYTIEDLLNNMISEP